MFEEKTERTSAGVWIAVAAIVLLAAGAGLWWFHRANHAFADATIEAVQTVPLHRRYAHIFGHVGEDQSDDTLYFVVRASVTNRSANPIYLKSMTLHMTDATGEHVSEAFQPADLPRIFTGVPQVKAAVDAVGVKPLLRETELPQAASTDGSMVFQLADITPEAWTKRQSASLQMDFYHNSSLTLPLPK